MSGKWVVLLTLCSIVYVLTDVTEAVVDVNRRRLTTSTTPPTTTTTEQGARPTNNRSQRNRGRLHSSNRITVGQPGSNIEFTWNWPSQRRWSLSRADRWWQGPNVCQHSETRTRVTDGEEITSGDDSSSPVVFHHRFMMTSYCDDTENAFKCVNIQSYNGNTTTEISLHECCHGYRREPDTLGCTQSLTLQPMADTLRSLEVGGLVRAIDSVGGLESLLTADNITVFAPTDTAFNEFQSSPNTDENSVVVISPKLRNVAEALDEIISSHVVNALVPSTHFDNDVLLDTHTPGAKIRINIFNVPNKITTANCVPIVSSDNQATNGIVHTVSRVLAPVVKTIDQLIEQTPELSTFNNMIQRTNLMRRLRSTGHVTIFAPNNNAFSKLSESVRRKLFDDGKCLSSLILHHVVDHVVCSASVEDRIHTSNALTNQLNVTRHVDTDSEILRVNGAQLLTSDLMASDGVLHIIDEILIPDDALGALNVAVRLNATNFVRLANRAQLTETFDGLANFTVFLPVNEAFKNADVDVVMKRPTDELSKVVKHHVVPGVLTLNRLNFNGQLKTLANRTLHASVNHHFPFSRAVHRMIQCSNIVRGDIAVCGGVIHLVDKVLTVPNGNLLDQLYERPELSQLVELIKSTDLVEQLPHHEQATIFAPTNQAFSALPQHVWSELRQDPVKAKLVLEKHIVRDIHCCSALGNHHQNPFTMSHRLQSINGRHSLSASQSHNQTTIDNVPVKTCDLVATNGVVHTVDQFLPSSLRHHVGRNGGRRHHSQPGSIQLRQPLDQWIANLFHGWAIEEETDDGADR